jgi:Cdc6-like AAA superfamily ATPase
VDHVARTAILIRAGLPAAVDAFVAEVGDIVDGLAAPVAGVDRDALGNDVTVEAYNLTCACIDSDGLHTDDELWALTEAFGPRLNQQLARATPDDLRASGIVEGKRAWLDTPSTLFDLLVRADQRDGSRHANRYYDRALTIAHTVASIDSHTSRQELEAIESFRSVLLRAMDDADVPRPGVAAEPKPAEPATSAEPPKPDLPPARPLPELLAELDALVGLAAVKAEVRMVADLIQIQNLRRERKLPVLDQSRHLVFTGNPGTGKTTVARLLAQIYRTLGVVDRGQLVETDRSGMVAGYVGQTAKLVVAVFDQADEGVLLIDEAYALARGGEHDFGREAIDTLVKLIEDRRDRLVVIAAGYPDEMSTFIGSNPGLRSRFPKTIEFPDYTTEELVAIFGTLMEKGRYRLDDEAAAKLRSWFDAQPRDKGFGNGRLARNVFEDAVARQATRLVKIADPTDDQLLTLTPEDLP